MFWVMSNEGRCFDVAFNCDLHLLYKPLKSEYIKQN